METYKRRTLDFPQNRGVGERFVCHVRLLTANHSAQIPQLLGHWTRGVQCLVVQYKSDETKKQAIILRNRINIFGLKHTRIPKRATGCDDRTRYTPGTIGLSVVHWCASPAS